MARARASHILVKTEKEAKEVIAEVSKPGADFAQVARARSTGPSGRNGGDLGFFGRGQMVKPFSDAAYALEPNQITQTPVRTQFGWHVIKVVAKRPVPVPSFADAEEQLRREASQKAIADLVKDLRGKTAVTNFTMQGTPERPSGIRRVP